MFIFWSGKVRKGALWLQMLGFSLGGPRDSLLWSLLLSDTSGTKRAGLLAFLPRRPVLGRRWGGSLEKGKGGAYLLLASIVNRAYRFFSSKLTFILFLLSLCTCICSQLSSVEILKVVGERLEENDEMVEDYTKNLIYKRLWYKQLQRLKIYVLFLFKLWGKDALFL